MKCIPFLQSLVSFFSFFFFLKLPPYVLATRSHDPYVCMYLHILPNTARPHRLKQFLVRITMQISVQVSFFGSCHSRMFSKRIFTYLPICVYCRKTLYVVFLLKALAFYSKSIKICVLTFQVSLGK
jgi:hypothetical protein